MKKITLSVFAAVAAFTNAFSQANISVFTPPKTNVFVDILPRGTVDCSKYTGVYLYTAADLSALTGTDVTGIGIPVEIGAAAAAPGTCTVYLENTSDVSYLKGTSFTTAISTMAEHYSGAYNIPTADNSTVNINFTAAQHFTYTGGGIYVAIKWTSTGNLSASGNANSAGYPSNLGSAGSMAAYEEAVQSATLTDVLVEDGTRPCLIFRAANMATNELGVSSIVALGKVAKNLQDPQTVTAIVRNNSINTLTGKTVSLSVTGANAFSDSFTIPSVNAGQTFAVSFGQYTSTAQGINTIKVSLLDADQNAANDMLTWTQSVTCNMLSNGPPTGTYTDNIGNSATYRTAFITPFTVTNSQTLTSVRLAISSGGAADGAKISGVLIDNGGNIIAETPSVNVTSAMGGTWRIFNFTDEDIQNGLTQLGGGNTYYIGMVKAGGTTYPMGRFETSENGQEYSWNETSGAINPVTNPQVFGYYGIEPILGPYVSISVPSQTLFCKGDTISLEANGATTYTWSGNNLAANVTAANRTLTVLSTAPNFTAASGSATYTYSLRGADATGCTGTTSIAMKVQNCSGVGVNEVKANDNIVLYPNPTVSGKSEIRGLEGKNNVTVYNMLGQKVLHFVSSEETVKIDLTNQPSGNYIVRIINDSNQSKTIKFINQN